jgi:hypothetical protein
MRVAFVKTVDADALARDAVLQAIVRGARVAPMWRAACHGAAMALTRARLGLVIVLSYAAPNGAAAEPATFHLQRIRTPEARLHALVERGLRESPTFRALAARLEQSDVIVYLIADICAPPGIAGRLTFLSATGGVRYVLVRLRPLGSSLLEVAVLAHELQHAGEIADHASIVDADALAREYLRIGHVNRAMPAGTAFDTRAAIDVGYQVLRELEAAARDVEIEAFDNE